MNRSRALSWEDLPTVLKVEPPATPAEVEAAWEAVKAAYAAPARHQRMFEARWPRGRRGLTLAAIGQQEERHQERVRQITATIVHRMGLHIRKAREQKEG